MPQICLTVQLKPVWDQAKLDREFAYLYSYAKRKPSKRRFKHKVRLALKRSGVPANFAEAFMNALNL